MVELNPMAVIFNILLPGVSKVILKEAEPFTKEYPLVLNPVKLS